MPQQERNGFLMMMKKIRKEGPFRDFKMSEGTVWNQQKLITRYSKSRFQIPWSIYFMQELFKVQLRFFKANGMPFAKSKVMDQLFTIRRETHLLF